MRWTFPLSPGTCALGLAAVALAAALWPLAARSESPAPAHLDSVSKALPSPSAPRTIAGGVVEPRNTSSTPSEPVPGQRPPVAHSARSDLLRQSLASMATPSGETLETPVPERWLPSRGRQCFRGRHRGFCQGPRRAPLPQGPAAALAEQLELGDVKTVSHLLLDPPWPAWVEAAGSADPEATLRWPVDEGVLWRGYGRPGRGGKRRRMHRGVDIGAPKGTPFRAARSGLVVYSDNGIRGYGNMMIIVHPDASVTFYAHARALFLFPGQKARRGQVVGRVGDTGIARGAHLHFEYRKRGRPRNPMRLFPEEYRNR